MVHKEKKRLQCDDDEVFLNNGNSYLFILSLLNFFGNVRNCRKLVKHVIKEADILGITGFSWVILK